ncbi:hypothetical protein RFI_05667 [Reticulomyxa filosa]|uniref:Uncharacterized protein n=1 Tax=Reticulomyxa filosa TaxID=46433 RepID=X6NZZ2_RETFI|nr:hypothetical protein RFI_05667 [Reticulomyxa filosa]|eukprot:ETO31453.1 hypothetical protein RFI_05667 [Reticulomyxa filosa]
MLNLLIAALSFLFIGVIILGYALTRIVRNVASERNSLAQIRSSSGSQVTLFAVPYVSLFTVLLVFFIFALYCNFENNHPPFAYILQMILVEQSLIGLTKGYFYRLEWYRVRLVCFTGGLTLRRYFMRDYNLYTFLLTSAVICECLLYIFGIISADSLLTVIIILVAASLLDACLLVFFINGWYNTAKVIELSTKELWRCIDFMHWCHEMVTYFMLFAGIVTSCNVLVIAYLVWIQSTLSHQYHVAFEDASSTGAFLWVFQSLFCTHVLLLMLLSMSRRETYLLDNRIPPLSQSITGSIDDNDWLCNLCLIQVDQRLCTFWKTNTLFFQYFQVVALKYQLQSDIHAMILNLFEEQFIGEIVIDYLFGPAHHTLSAPHTWPKYGRRVEQTVHTYWTHEFDCMIYGKDSVAVTTTEKQLKLSLCQNRKQHDLKYFVASRMYNQMALEP